MFLGVESLEDDRVVFAAVALSSPAALSSDLVEARAEAAVVEEQEVGVVVEPGEPLEALSRGQVGAPG